MSSVEAQKKVIVKNFFTKTGLLKNQFIPKWGEQIILESYKTAVNAAAKWSMEMDIDKLDGKVRPDTLKRYAFYMGQVTALEGVMERLFIPYDDKGKLR